MLTIAILKAAVLTTCLWKNLADRWAEYFGI